MMRFLRKGERYAPEKPIRKYYYLSLSSFKCWVLSLSTYCYQFSCNVQESRASGATGYGKRRKGSDGRISVALLLKIFCVLFGFASVVEVQAQESRQGGATGFDVVSDTVIRGHKIVPYKNELVIKRLEENTSYDLKKFPMVVYDIDRTLVDGVAIGGRIPDELWNVPLKIVNGEGEIKNVRLSEFATDQILILDFWTTWCKPCIESVIKWEAISAKVPDRVKVVNVLLDFEYKAPLFLAKRDWQSPTAIGMSAYLLNAYFFTSETFGKIVWIQSGKLQSITTASQLSKQELEDVVMGRLDFPESLKEGTYGLNLSKS